MKASEAEEQHSMANAIIGSSDDLLPLILINLPIKSLARFQLVSKQWKFIICDDRDFATKHSRKSSSSSSPCGVFVNSHYFRNQTTGFIPLSGNRFGNAPSLSFLDQIRNDLVLEQVRSPKVLVPAESVLDVGLTQRILSCNGLLLCIFSLAFVFGDRKHVFVVCNPTTKRLKILPQMSLKITDNLYGFTLVFLPSESPHYRVVALKCYWERSKTEIQMYSSETDCWKLVRMIPGRYYCQPSRGVFSNGYVYWLGLKSHNRLFYYNLNSDSFGTLDIPPEPCRSFNKRIVESCWRVFFVFDIRPYYYDSEVKIYELDSSNMQSFITQQRGRSMVVKGICIPFESLHCEYVPSLAPV